MTSGLRPKHSSEAGSLHILLNLFLQFLEGPSLLKVHKSMMQWCWLFGLQVHEWCEIMKDSD